MKIITQGTARKEVMPDVATLNFRFSARSRDRASAVEQVNRALSLLRAELADADARVKSERASTGSWLEKKVKKYEVSVSLVVESSAGETITDLLQAGIDIADCEVNGPYWSVSPGNPVHQEVREAAIHEAIDRAKAYASALNGSVVGILEIRDEEVGSIDVRPVLFAAASARSIDSGAPLDVSSGPQPTEVSASVIATFEAGDVRV